MIDYKDLDTFDRAGAYLISLLCAVLHESPAPDLPEGLLWSDVYDMAKLHCVEAMAFYGACDQIKSDEELYKKWKRSRDIAQVQSLMQTEENRNVCEELSRAGIRFMTFKGLELKHLYKQDDLRQMADIDLLIDPENAQKARQLMESLGYETIGFGEREPDNKTMEHHDEYFKAPFVTVEIHRQLMLVGDKDQEYYDDVFDRAIPDKELPGAFKLGPEDMYIYLLAHFHKHYKRMGSGIRSVMDIYMYQQRYGESLDWDHIEKELKIFGIYDFALKMESLAYRWFKGAETVYTPQKMIGLSGEEYKQLQRNILLAGNYGSREYAKARMMGEAKAKNSLTGRMSYIFQRVFMNSEDMKKAYPGLRRHPVLLPFYWIYRLIDSCLHKQGAIRRELGLLREHQRKKDGP